MKVLLTIISATCLLTACERNSTNDDTNPPRPSSESNTNSGSTGMGSGTGSGTSDSAGTYGSGSSGTEDGTGAGSTTGGVDRRNESVDPTGRAVTPTPSPTMSPSI